MNVSGILEKAKSLLSRSKSLLGSSAEEFPEYMTEAEQAFMRRKDELSKAWDLTPLRWDKILLSVDPRKPAEILAHTPLNELNYTPRSDERNHFYARVLKTIEKFSEHPGLAKATEQEKHSLLQGIANRAVDVFQDTVYHKLGTKQKPNLNFIEELMERSGIDYHAEALKEAITRDLREAQATVLKDNLKKFGFPETGTWEDLEEPMRQHRGLLIQEQVDQGKMPWTQAFLDSGGPKSERVMMK